MRKIESVAQLETLLLLHDNPDLAWTPARFAERLYANEGDMRAILSALCRNRLASLEGDAYRYDRGTPFAAIVDRLAQAYRDQLIAVTNLIHAKQRRAHGRDGPV